MHQTAKKLVLVWATSAFMSKVRSENKVLVRIPSIHYSIRFKKDINNIKALFDFGNEINVISLMYGLKLDLYICCTNVSAQKINQSIFAIFEIIMAIFQIQNQ